MVCGEFACLFVYMHLNMLDYIKFVLMSGAEVTLTFNMN